MSPSTAPPFCSLTWTARIVPLTRPQTVTFCAMMLPSTCAPRAPRLRFGRRPALDLCIRCCRRSTCRSRCKRPFPLLSSALTSPTPAHPPAPPPQRPRAHCRPAPFLPGCAALSAIQPLHLHARADARSRFRFWYQRGRRDLFNNRVLLLHHPPMTSAAFAAAFLSFSGALLLNNMSTSVFAGMQCRNSKCRDQRKRRTLRLGCR